MEVLKTQNLTVSVWHNDTFGWNSLLGKVDLDLSEWDFSNTQINEYALKARVKASFLCRVCMYYRRDLIRHVLTSAETFRLQHRLHHHLHQVWRTPEHRWESPWDSCHRRPTVSSSSLSFYHIFFFCFTLILIWLHPQVREHLGWRRVRYRFGWKTARIFLQSEDSSSTRLWNGTFECCAFLGYV